MFLSGFGSSSRPNTGVLLMKNRFLLYGLAVFAALFLGGCATQGDPVRISIAMPGGERATMVAHPQSVPDWMLARDGLKLNYLVKTDVSERQLKAVAEVERACRIYTGTVRPSNLALVLSHGILYAAAGFVGVGIGANAFDFVKPSQYAEYGAWASGLGGTANGIVTLGGQTYTFENCGREVMGLFPGYEVRVILKSPY